MCGICGYISCETYNGEVIEKMTETIAYRGPDDKGHLLDRFKEKQIAFGHRRLAIIDLSADGHQPMTSENGSITVVYNGEIYNYNAIARELVDCGYSFKTKCDTEVIIKAYQHWGIQCLSKFNGMFAIAIYDRPVEKLYLVRDRMGVKPLYYYWNESDLVFGSELKPIMKAPFFNKSINRSVLNTFLINQYIAGPETIFHNTYKLQPGTYVCFDGNQLKHEVYWSTKDVFNNRDILKSNYKEIEDDLEDLLKDSIRLRMIADVPVGMFLSGGVDSSLVTALAQSIRDKPVETFTIGFHENAFNEANYAKEVSNILGTHHHEVYCSIDEAKQMIYDIPKFYDEPFADSSQLPTMMVSRIASEKVTVALSGDAGDELFCGYNSYDTLIKQEKLIGWGKSLSKNYKYHETGHPVLWRLGKLLKSDDVETALNIDHYNGDDIVRKLTDISGEKPLRRMAINGINTDNIQELRMLLDTMTYLPDDILTKVDRASMRYSLEARTPFLDYRVVRMSYDIPHKYKYFNGDKKYILKQILCKYIPEKTVYRPKKGFSIPINQWLHNDFLHLISDKLNSDRLKRQGLFNVEEVSKFVGNFHNYKSGILDRIMWSMLIFQLWYDEYYEKY